MMYELNKTYKIRIKIPNFDKPIVLTCEILSEDDISLKVKTLDKVNPVRIIYKNQLIDAVLYGDVNGKGSC